MTQENIPQSQLAPRPMRWHQSDTPPAVEYDAEEYSDSPASLDATAITKNGNKSEHHDISTHQSAVEQEDASPDMMPENNPGGKGTAGAALLSGMRNYLCLRAKRIIASNAKVPPRSSAALSQLIRISQLNRPKEQPEAVGPLDARRLFLNVYAYAAAERPELTGQLRSPDVLRQMYEPYLADVMRFKEESIPRAVFMALLHPASLLDDIATQYEPYEFINKTAIVTVLSSRPRAPEQALGELVAAVEHFKADTEPRLRAEYGIESAWDADFVRSMIQSPHDAETAARTILKHTQTLQRKYPHIKPKRIAALAETQLFPRRNPAIAADVAAEMRKSTASNDIERGALEQGREQLNRIRAIVRRPVVTRGRRDAMRQSPLMAELSRQVSQSGDAAFDILNDMRFETFRLEAAVVAYNDSLGADESQLKIAMEADTLYAVFLAYALDVGRLKAKGYDLGATTVAWYHDAEIYDRYITKYEGQEGATAAEIVAAIQYRPTQIEQQIEGLLIRKRMGL